MILAKVAAEASGENFTPLMDHIAEGFEALGAAILVVGVIWSFVLAAVAARRFGWSARAYLVLRQAFGGTLHYRAEARDSTLMDCSCACSYSRASMATASRSRSMYGSPLTSTATRLIVPPVKRCGDSFG
jgi:hypothetical protein